jgi:hypothetical protein
MSMPVLQVDLSNQHGVVLRASRQHLDHATHLLIATDHRIEFTVFSVLSQVACVFGQRVVVGFGVGARDLPGSSHGLDCVFELSARESRGGEGGVAVAVLVQRHQQMIDGRVAVLLRLLQLLCLAQYGEEFCIGAQVVRRGILARQFAQGLVQRILHVLQGQVLSAHGGLLHELHAERLGILEQHGCEMQGMHVDVAQFLGQRHGFAHRTGGHA